MAQLQRLRAHLDTHERAFATVSGFAQFISTLTSTHTATCTIRMCFLQGSYFATNHYSGTHLEFVDEESASSFQEISNILKILPQALTGRELCRITVWEQSNYEALQPGVVYEIHHVYGFKTFNEMPQASVAAASVMASVNARFNSTTSCVDEPTGHDEHVAK